MSAEIANANVNRVATLAGTSIAIFTFLVFFLYPRRNEIDYTIFEVTLTVIGLAVFSLVFAGLHYYQLTLPGFLNGAQIASHLRTGDRFWLVGYSLLLLEPTLILLTIQVYRVAVIWLIMWLLYVVFNARWFGKRPTTGAMPHSS